MTIGEEGQRRLASGSVFVVGCGALGGQVAMLLAGAGVGRIGIADFDTVDITNLQRQLFFAESLQGESKAASVAARMRALNSEIDVRVHECRVDEGNAAELFKDYDFIIDATDSPESKYMIDAVCLRLRKDCCIGGVSGWSGQVMSALIDVDGNSSARFSEIFPKPDAQTLEQIHRKKGVIGAAPSTVASIEAAEALKYLIHRDVEKPCSYAQLKDVMIVDEFLAIDLLHDIFRKVRVRN